MSSCQKTVIGILARKIGLINANELAELLENRLPDVRVEVCSSIADMDSELDVLQDFGGSADDFEKLNSAEIIIGSLGLCASLNLQLTNLKWFQSYMAGVDGIRGNLKSLEKPSYIVTRNGSMFVDTVSQFVLGQIIAHERNFIFAYQNQLKRAWARRTCRNMKSLSIGILGVGAIGKEIARLSKAINLTVWGLVRTLPTATERCVHVDHYRCTNDLPELLSSCDYVCNVLPSTSETDNLLDGDMLSYCKQKQSVFINVGRGNVVKDATVIRALSEGWLSHAILDVFEKEPLSADSELWAHPNVTVSPHISGGRFDAVEFVETFATNYERYKKGEPLDFVVDLSRGY